MCRALVGASDGTLASSVRELKEESLGAQGREMSRGGALLAVITNMRAVCGKRGRIEQTTMASERAATLSGGKQMTRAPTVVYMRRATRLARPLSRLACSVDLARRLWPLSTERRVEQCSACWGQQIGGRQRESAPTGLRAYGVGFRTPLACLKIKPSLDLRCPPC